MKCKDIRILQLGKFYPMRGGVEKVMYDLMEGISAGGIRCDMLCAASSGGASTRKLNDDAELLMTRTWFRFSGTMISPGMIAVLKKICGQYDIIHIHHPDPMAALALRLSGYRGKVVLQWHSDIVKPRLMMRLYSPLQKWLLRRADVILGTTMTYLVQSPQLKGVSSKFRELPIGIDPVLPDPKASESIRRIYGGRKIVFSLGRMVPYKGFSYLIEAAKHLPKEYMVVIGGEGPLEEELRARIDNPEFADRVILLGRVSEQDLPAWYGACNVFCLSSVFKTEAFGIVQIEAMSCGKPVIATMIPESGVSEVNMDGFSGINVKPRSPKSIAEAVLEINKDEDTYNTFSRNAKARFEDKFTLEKMISSCLDVYESIIQCE